MLQAVFLSLYVFFPSSPEAVLACDVICRCCCAFFVYGGRSSIGMMVWQVGWGAEAMDAIPLRKEEDAVVGFKTWRIFFCWSW